MQVTEVDIAFVKPKDGLIAFASVVLDDQLYLSGIAIHSKLRRRWLPPDLSDPKGWAGSVESLPSDSQDGWARDRAGHRREAEERIEQA